MLRVILFSLVATVLVPALAVQVPLGSSHGWQDGHNPGILDDKDPIEWSLDRLPNPNATDHLVFETVHSLLQHWPNTRMRNGHNIVPGNIPKGTLLYQGTSRRELPPGPEWVATDPEHSYSFCRIAVDDFQRAQGCWHLTLATTRPLKVVYFDGSSAVNLPYGSMDIQDLVIWGALGHDDITDEYMRIERLCRWGKDFGVDGIVRMEMDFEIMLCDFTAGVSVVSFVNLLSPRPVLPRTVVFEVMAAGSWHNRFPGETRIQLDLTRLVSFYDTQLAPSLVEIRVGQEKWDYRPGNISSEDFLAVKSRLEAVLIKPPVQSSGIDWKTLVQVIVDRFAQRLELTRYLLNSSATDPDDILDLANKTQSQLRIMLTPYLLLSATPTNQSDSTNLDWTIPIYKLCATTHTYPMKSELDSMTDSEKLLLQAVRGTTREICRVVTKMWAAGVYAGIDSSLNTDESHDIAKIAHLRSTWMGDLNRLMAWLDWNVWVKCNPGCRPEEICYLPTWPIGFPGKDLDRLGWSRKSLPLADPDGPHLDRLTSLDFRTMMGNTFEEDSDEWIRPQPKCVRRVDPYEF